MPNLVTCPCQNCNGHIQFDPATLSAENNRIACPHCGLETILCIPQAPTTPKPIQVSPASYIDENLMTGEFVAGTAVLHWVVYFQIIPACFLALVLAILLVELNDDHFPIFMFILVLTFTVGLAALDAFIKKKTSEFAVTNKRVLMKYGFIRRCSVEIVLGKIESIKVDQDILGRILDYGTIIVCGTGGTKDPFHKITSPLAFRQAIQTEIEKTGDKQL